MDFTKGRINNSNIKRRGGERRNFERIGKEDALVEMINEGCEERFEDSQE